MGYITCTFWFLIIQNLSSFTCLDYQIQCKHNYKKFKTFCTFKCKHTKQKNPFLSNQTNWNGLWNLINLTIVKQGCNQGYWEFYSLKSSLSSTGIGWFLQYTARPLPPSCKIPKHGHIYINPSLRRQLSITRKRKHNQLVDRMKSLTAMQTTLTAEGTATSGFVKCFWASKNPSAELCTHT